MSKPTLDEILEEAIDILESGYNTAGHEKAKQQLTQLIADIVTEPNGNMMPPTIDDGIRQRAKERGINL